MTESRSAHVRSCRIARSIVRLQRALPNSRGCQRSPRFVPAYVIFVGEHESKQYQTISYSVAYDRTREKTAGPVAVSLTDEPILRTFGASASGPDRLDQRPAEMRAERKITSPRSELAGELDSLPSPRSFLPRYARILANPPKKCGLFPRQGCPNPPIPAVRAGKEWRVARHRGTGPSGSERRDRHDRYRLQSCGTCWRPKSRRGAGPAPVAHAFHPLSCTVSVKATVSR